MGKWAGIIYPLKYLPRKIRMRSKCRFGKSSVPVNTLFEGRNSIGGNVRIINCYLGEGTYIGTDSNISGAKIGKYCSIGDNVRTAIGRHPVEQFVSTFPAFYYNTTPQIGFTFYNGTEPLYKPVQEIEDGYSIVIGNDVWIGSGALICGGIKIGDGAVIAAGAVVVKDVEPYSIVGGVPAKEIKKRFGSEDIEKLLAVKWWNMGSKWIDNNKDKFTDIVLFLKNG